MGTTCSVQSHDLLGPGGGGDVESFIRDPFPVVSVGGRPLLMLCLALEGMPTL